MNTFSNSTASTAFSTTQMVLPDQRAFQESDESSDDRMETYLAIHDSFQLELLRTIKILSANLDNLVRDNAKNNIILSSYDFLQYFNHTLALRKVVSVAKQLRDLGTEGLEVDKNKLKTMEKFLDTIVFDSKCPFTPIAFKDATHMPSVVNIFYLGCDFLEVVNAFTGYTVQKEALANFLKHVTVYAGI
jgi:hypothetical protein